MITNNFIKRHNGPQNEELDYMLKSIGVSSLDQLIDETIPTSIKLPKDLNLPKGLNEYEYLNHIRKIGAKNKIFKTFIGLGFYNTITPPVILRNILENPGWYTSYTPYQAEISQGRLEALLNYQTMITDLTGLPLANASLLDESSAAAEAMIMSFNARSREKTKKGANNYFVSNGVFLHTIDVLKNRALPLGINLVIGDYQSVKFDDTYFGTLIQYPNQFGLVCDYKDFVVKAHSSEVMVAVAADILSLALLTPPGEWGADIALGSTQRFGVPMGFGGPHAAFFATKEEFKRSMPGRIIGISVDKHGNRALRMALQTREQHIKRERATSNICTAQALLAIMAGFYAAYHGQNGIREIARHINILTGVLSQEMKKYGYIQKNEYFFDTLFVEIPGEVNSREVMKIAVKNEINFRYIDERHLGISIDETTTLADINLILKILASCNVKNYNEFICKPAECELITTIPGGLARKTPFLTHPVFNSYHSETEMMRYMKKLENKDLALNRTMIPLGSCTMKLNAVAELMPITWPEFASIHPFVPTDQSAGYKELIDNFEKDLCKITGFDAISFQPNSGATGEYTGLAVIRAYQKNNQQGHRDICLIPSSAHGTNPASSVMAGLKVVVVKCDENGNIDTADLKAKAIEYKETLSCIMITYPSTHGVFEENILEIIDIIHQNGGQVYMDGANMNAQVGLTNPGIIGADVCHLNLHKTFAIPHGGGGPGVGPIGVARHLAPYLPRHIYAETGGGRGINAVAAGPYGSAMILPISYGYVKMLGGEGIKEATKYAILNANYLKAKLQDHYKILYKGRKGHVAHEMILDCNEFFKTAHVAVIDIAKRLMDYGFHAPTVAFPVHGTLMVEPTESEPLSELNRFVEAMIAIRQEIKEIEDGNSSQDNNVVLNAPHTLAEATAENWVYPYSRAKAIYPIENLREDKYFTPIGKVDDAYGDRNLVCSCISIELYQ